MSENGREGPSEIPSPDPGLLARFRDGDEDAFRALFAECEPVLRARVHRWLNDRMRRRLSVADVLQETRLVAFLRREDFAPEGPAPFRRWLLGILRMKLKEMSRRHAGTAKRSVDREIPPGSRPDTGYFPYRGPTPSEVTVAAETLARARRALTRLPEDYREALILTWEEKLSLAEAAERMGRSREAFRKLVGRAICRFREAYDSLDGEA